MIQANDLRIGNLVLCGGNIKPVVGLYNDSGRICVQFTNGQYIRSKGADWAYLEECEPVPLADDWVLRCNQSINVVTRMGAGFDTIPNPWRVVHYGDYFYMSYPIPGGGEFLTRNFEYLHVLQNVWFANIGRELEIKL